MQSCGTENYGEFGTEFAINDNGDWVFSTDTDGPWASDGYVVRVVNGGFTAVAQEGQPVPALPGASWGTILRNVVVDEAGNVGLMGRSLAGVDLSQNQLLVLGSTALAQRGVTVPAGQVGSEFWDNFDFAELHVSADGSS